MTSTIDNTQKYVFVSADHGNLALKTMKQHLDSEKVSNKQYYAYSSKLQICVERNGLMMTNNFLFNLGCHWSKLKLKKLGLQ